MVRFGMGIIKGAYKNSKLIVQLENPKISACHTVEVAEDRLGEFLLQHDYAVYKKRNGDLSFEKIFMENRLGDYLKKTASPSHMYLRLGVSSYINKLQGEQSGIATRTPCSRF